MAETLWQRLTGANFQQAQSSVHLQGWPASFTADSEVLADMDLARQAVELGLAARDQAGVKIRQALASAKFANLNLSEVTCQSGNETLQIDLDTVLTPELELLGAQRELIRAVNNLRKTAGLTIGDRIIVYYQSSSNLFDRLDDQSLADLASQTLSQSWQVGAPSETLAETELQLLDQTISLKIIKV
jgi:isoleucyl-tRNA synthetase